MIDWMWELQSGGSHIEFRLQLLKAHAHHREVVKEWYIRIHFIKSSLSVHGVALHFPALSTDCHPSHGT